MVTVFFMDTAHNVIDYIEAIYKILQPGGCWINLGNPNLLFLYNTTVLEYAGVSVSLKSTKPFTAVFLIVTNLVTVPVLS